MSRQRAPGDRVVPWHQVARVLGPGLALLIVLQIVRLQPDLVERVFTEGFGRLAEGALATIFGWLPFSLAEWIEGGLGLLLVGAAVHAGVGVVRRQRSPRNTVEHGLARVLVLTVIALVGFELTWGLNYGRRPMLDRMGWSEVDPTLPMATTQLIWLADDLVDLTNDRYLAIHHSDDAGAMTAAPDRATLDAGVEAGWREAVRVLDLHRSLARRRPPAKPLLASPLVSRMGLSGFYFPFTSEANYNALTPGWQLPHTVAHEKAHQRGFASEDEANFAGFVVCIQSPDPVVQYSGLLFAQRRLLFSLLSVDPDTAMALILRRLPGVQRDVTEARAFWAGQEGQLMDVSQAVNDAYLRANRVRGGIQSYSLSTELILAWAHTRGLEVGPVSLTGSSHPR